MRACCFVLAGALTLLAGQAPSGAIEQARALDAQGVALAQVGKLGEAIEQFRNALRLVPDFAEAHYHLALAYDGLGQTDEAMSRLNEALRLRRDFIPARYLLA